MKIRGFYISKEVERAAKPFDFPPPVPASREGGRRRINQRHSRRGLARREETFSGAQRIDDVVEIFVGDAKGDRRPMT